MVRRTSRVASQYASEADLFELLWLDLALHFALAVPIPYVQAAILNLLNPYNLYGVATAFRDSSQSTHSILKLFTNATGLLGQKKSTSPHLCT